MVIAIVEQRYSCHNEQEEQDRTTRRELYFKSGLQIFCIRIDITVGYFEKLLQ